MEEDIQKTDQGVVEGVKSEAPAAALPTSPPSSNEMAELKKEIMDLREKLLQCREGDIFSLKEKVASLTSQLRLSLTIVGIGAAILGGFGIKQYGDLNDLINKSMTQKIEDSLGYYDQESRAIMLVNNGGCSSAIPIFKELLEKRIDDEIAFVNAMHCFNDREEYEQGYQLLSRLKEKGAFPRKYQQLFSHNNAGFLVLVKSFSNPSFEREAQELLRRAEQIGMTEDTKEVVYPLYNLMLFHVAKGEIDKAAVYSDRIKELDIEGPNWKDGVDRIWFKQLEAKQPDTRKLLQQLMPGKKATTPSESQPSNKQF